MSKTKENPNTLYEIRIYDKEHNLKKRVSRKAVNKQYQKFYEMRGDEFGPEGLIKVSDPGTRLVFLRKAISAVEYYCRNNGCQNSPEEPYIKSF